MGQSRARDFKPGDPLASNFGWRECFIVSPEGLHPVHRQIQPFSVYLGALGMAERASLCRSLSRDPDCENTFAVALTVIHKRKTKQSIMNTLKIKGDWNITKGKLKQKWAKLTDDDLQCAEGKHDELLGRIQKRTGETREAVEKAVKEASACCCK
jgi:uncharacterized protein YjbJ (UPF0337 family)